MNPVHAPKDPDKNRPFIALFIHKKIFGNPQPDGRGLQNLFLNGRIRHFAHVNGNLDDENMLSMLEHAGTFKKLVHSIGVSITGEDRRHEADFFLQMNGTIAENIGGVTLTRHFVMDGMEQRIVLSEEDWCEDDCPTGLIRIILPAGEAAEITVKLYINDGYDAPPAPSEEQPKLFGEAYDKMIARSLMAKGNGYRIRTFLEKARNGEEVTVGFIGGSITQGAGSIPISQLSYARRFYEKLIDYVGKEHESAFRFIKAGAGGTSSELGMIRYDFDVTEDGKKLPDLVVVEYAVNDNDDELEGKSYDSLVRKIYLSENKPAVILLMSVFSDDFNLQERHRKVGDAYHLPMVSIKDAVVPQFYQETETLITKSQFFYDIFHPSNFGHEIMADCLMNAVKSADEINAASDSSVSSASDAETDEAAALEKDFDISSVEAPYSCSFEKIQLIDRKHLKDVCISEGGFSEKDTDLQSVERDFNPFGTPEFPENWMHTLENEAPFALDVTCRSLFLAAKDSGLIDFGKADISVDGKLIRTVDPRKVGWTHCNAFFLFEETEAKPHHVEIRMAKGDSGKRFTILGFGVVR